MTQNPHSLLDAVKITANAAGLEWATAHRYYRDLQGASRSDAEVYWLPKSQGRTIWHAHPNYLSRFLVAIGMTDDPTLACPIVSASLQFTPDARDRYEVEAIEHPVEYCLSSLLADPIAADTVDRVEFDPMKLRIVVYFRNGDEKMFGSPATGEQSSRNVVMYRRGIIPGAVFSIMSRKINWRIDSPVITTNGELDPEA